LQHRVDWCEFTDVSEVCTASIFRTMIIHPPSSIHASVIALMMEAVRTSETMINLYQPTWRYKPEEAIFIHAAMRT
jgi:hypothetical protein